MTPKFTCFYPIFNLPPCVFHFNTALILSTREGVGNVIVIIPNIKSDTVDQDACVKLFEFYGTAHPLIDIKIEKSTYENAFEDIQARFKKEPSLMAYIALDEKTAKSSEFHQAFGDNNNLDLELIPSNFGKTSAKMREAIKTGNKKEFLQYVPENLTPDHKEECWNIVHPNVAEQIISKEFWKKIITENFTSCDIFNESTTGMANYDAMIEHPSYYFFFKDQTISLERMTPQEYIQLCATNVHDTTFDVELDNIDIPDVKGLIDQVKAGNKLDTPILNADDKSQEGRHRSIVAAHFGCETIPVYVISKVHGGKQKDAVKIVNQAPDYTVAKKELLKIGVPLDEKTYQKVKWLDFKTDTEK